MSNLTIDIIVSHDGSISLFHPMTDTARAWIADNVQRDAQWFGSSLAVEARYVDDLMRGMLHDGLVLDPDGGQNG